MYDNELACNNLRWLLPSVSHFTLLFTGILFYDFFGRERIPRVNDAYALRKIRAKPILCGLYLRFTVITKIVHLLRD